MSTHTTEEIKARINIVELIGAYVRLEKSGVHYKACCPFHQERTPSFMVNEEKNMWHCFGCGKGGDVFAFVMEMEGLDFRESLVMLAEKAGVELPKYRQEAGEQKNDKERLLQILEWATKFFEKQLWEGAGKDKMLAYLKGRGLSEESVHTFRLGYAPDGWRYLLEFLTKKGYTTEEIEKTGLIIHKSSEVPQTTTHQVIASSSYYDRFRDRIMFPIFDIFGHTIGYSARVAPGGDESQAKYINTPETAIYHKSRALYGLYLAKQAMKQAGMTVIVEGNMDVIAMHQAGIKNTVAVSGTALTSEQLTMMKRYGNEVRLFFDMDGAGQKAARKSAELALQNELTVSMVALPFGKDAADMNQENPEALRTAVTAAVPALQYFLNAALAKEDRTSALGKRHIVDDYTALLQAVKNPIERSHAIKELARAIEMDEKLLIGIVNKAFLDAAHRSGPVPSPEMMNPLQKNHSFGKRSELLREELIALMYVDEGVRQELLGGLLDVETRAYLGMHPLFFFLLQAGASGPLALIEEATLKSEATRLSFRILESPEVADVPAEERAAVLSAMAKRYATDLCREVTSREKLLSLEKALNEARAKNDKELEKKLLVEFSTLSVKGLSSSE